MTHDLIQMNRFCNDLHNDENIIFCKTDYIVEEFNRISSKKNKIILIVGNSDYRFDDNLLKLCPNNVKHIFATNCTTSDNRVTPLPYGVEMEVQSSREGHGYVNESIFEKIPYLTGEIEGNKTPKNNKLLSNFTVSTNHNFRSPVESFSKNCDNINYLENIPFSDFASNVKSHLGTISPMGNGIECIRTYEVLYMGEIPFVIGNNHDYKNIKSKIYDELPIVFIDDLSKLNSIDFILNEIQRVQNKSKEFLSYSYWKNRIIEFSKKLT